MEVLVLGSGTSHGVPMIGCGCEVCRSANPKNKRMRPSILVETAQGNLLVDTTPELRMQALAFDVRQVDAVCITHTHADHIMGLDDLRRFNDLADKEIPVYGEAEVLDDVRRIYPYIFRETQLGGGKPRVTLHGLEIGSALPLLGLKVTPLRVLHGRLPITAYRFDEPEQGRQAAHRFAYVTDVSEIPAETMAQLRDLDVLILDAVRLDPHPTHFGLYQALDVIEILKPRRAFLTHLSHHFEHEAINAQLPDHVRLAYDGLRVAF